MSARAFFSSLACSGSVIPAVVGEGAGREHTADFF